MRCDAHLKNRRIEEAKGDCDSRVQSGPPKVASASDCHTSSFLLGALCYKLCFVYTICWDATAARLCARYSRFSCGLRQFSECSREKWIGCNSFRHFSLTGVLREQHLETQCRILYKQCSAVRALTGPI